MDNPHSLVIWLSKTGKTPQAALTTGEAETKSHRGAIKPGDPLWSIVVIPFKDIVDHFYGKTGK